MEETLRNSSRRTPISSPKPYFSRMAEISKIIRKQQSKLVDTLARKSHFKQDEVEGLLALYRKLSEGAEVDRLDRTRFRNCEYY